MSTVTAAKAQRYLKLFALRYVPLIFVLRPRIISIDEQHVEVALPLNFFSRNHVRSMYFGALAVGADCAGGILAMLMLRERGVNASFVFKSLNANFLKRADGDTHFRCDDGAKILSLIDQVANSDTRHETTVRVVATVPGKNPQEPVATFDLVLSVKRQQK